MKTVKLVQVNGAFYAKTRYGKTLLKSTGLGYTGGFLSLAALTDHVKTFNIKLEVI